MNDDSCLIVVNTLAGNYKSLDVEKLKRKLISSYKTIDVKYICEGCSALDNAVGYSAVAVCGGDGTLNHILNADIRDAYVYYVPCGTLNEVYDGGKRNTRITSVGSANEKLFSYVLAAGSFTPLGYRVNTVSKQRIKSLAYLLRVIKEYKVYSIPATITVDGVEKRDKYTLLMAINSPRCFGFRFNKMYEEGKLCLLTIRSPGKDTLINRLKMFFPFFRAFFVGFNKPYHSKNMTFTTFDTLRIETETQIEYCADGERSILPETFNVSIRNLEKPITIVV